MVPLIPLALNLAQFAPSLLRFFGADNKSVNTASTVIDIAKAVTGASTPEDAITMIQGDQAKRYEFNLKVLESEQRLQESYLKDMDSARKRDMVFIASGTRNYRADAMFFLAVIVIVGIAAAIWNTPGIDEYTKGIATLILGRFLGYLDNIYNFEFGSTRSSKQKDSTIESLSQDRTNADK